MTASYDGNGYYVGGLKEDSIFLMKIGLQGIVLWVRTLDVTTDESDHIVSMITDSEGNLVFVGNSGDSPGSNTIFAVKYDPILNTIIWARIYNHAEILRSHSLVELGINGNYLLHNTTVYPLTHDCQIFEIDRSDGSVVNSFAKEYHLGSADGLARLIHHEGFLYGVGRYMDPDAPAGFRNTMVKLDAVNGNQIWVKLGHIPSSQSARLYGWDIMMHNNHLYTGSYGDPNGNSTANTQLFLQMTNTDGELQWIKQYDLPGQNDVAYEMLDVADGIIIYGAMRGSNGQLVILKTDYTGNLLWSKRIHSPSFANQVPALDTRSPNCIQTGNKLVFTGWLSVSGGGNNMFLLETDLNGNTSSPCHSTSDLTVVVRVVSNPSFYDASPEVYASDVHSITRNLSFIQSDLNRRQECSMEDTVFSEVFKEICLGDTFEGYNATGIYVDEYFTVEGCDSIRTLYLTTVTCNDVCNIQPGAIYGEPDQEEKGFALSSKPGKDGVYLAGLKNDSLLLAEISLSGEVMWSRTLDVIPGRIEYAWTILTDNEGMIAVAGYAGDPNSSSTYFAFRYNPNVHQLLWVKEINLSNRGYSNAMIQKEDGTNYLLTLNPHYDGNSNNDCTIIELDKTTGVPVPSFAKNYHLGGSDALGDIVMKDGYIYGCGRYTDGAPNSRMRHVITKIDAVSGDVIWTRLGHVPRAQSARLYGTDIIPDGNFLYSTYHGDPGGTSLTITNSYIQKTDLDGDLIWLKKYDLPGNNDVNYEIVKSGNGFVVIGSKKSTPVQLIMYKINGDGEVLWAYSYDFDSIANPPTADGPVSLLVETADNLIFTASADNPSGGSDLILVRTDLNGVPDLPCVENSPVIIPVEDVSNPAFYNVQVEVNDVSPQLTNRALSSFTNLLQPREECVQQDTIKSYIEARICSGETFEGYTTTGIYEDQFQTALGCDSLRTLSLTVNAPVSTHLTATICFGENYQGYTTSGIYQDTFQSSFGCDSVVFIDLTVSYVMIALSAVICEGEEYLGYHKTGIYTDTISAINGLCDTIRTLTLTVLDPVHSSITEQICEGEHYEGYTVNGIYTDTILTVNGCDSIRTVFLEVLTAASSFIDLSLCDGAELGFTQPGIYLDTLIASDGCDSLITYNINGASRYIPNVFSPNGDGINDVFEIFRFPDNYLEFQYFAIFDRFGDMVYQTEEWPVMWKGFDKYGNFYNPAAFAYVLIYTCGGERIRETGNITLVR